MAAALEPSQLLGRPEVALDLDAARAFVSGRRLLVTGAAGSVGLPLVQTLIGLAPAHLVLVDHHEYTLFLVQRYLREWAPETAVDLALADVRDASRVDRLFRRHRPEVVFHLAAYKHVPLGEANPEEPLSVNVFGTLNVLEAAAAHGTEVVVYPSSDKAVYPPSLYGATKRIAELLVLRHGNAGVGARTAVRFVNILGTRGSVVETLAEQVLAGRPLTLTDPNMTRYWMSMGEAVGLLLVGAVAPTGSLLLLDTGPAVPVPEMAHRIARALAPDAWPPAIRFTGARPGERLWELLHAERERLLPGPCDGVWRVAHEQEPALRERVMRVADQLRSLPSTLAPDEVKAITMELVRELA